MNDESEEIKWFKIVDHNMFRPGPFKAKSKADFMLRVQDEFINYLLRAYTPPGFMGCSLDKHELLEESKRMCDEFEKNNLVEVEGPVPED